MRELVLISFSLILWLDAPTAAIAQVNADERGAAGAASNIVRAFVAEHTGVTPGRLVLDTTLQLLTAASGDPYSEAEPFPPGDRRSLAVHFDWGIGSYPDVVECQERCLLKDNVILFNVSRPTIRGDEAVISFSWHHNFGGLVRENRRVVKMRRSRGQQWEVVGVLSCVTTTGGGACALPSGR